MDSVPVIRSSFLEITREEQFFGSLLTHPLLASDTMRGLFARRREVTHIDLEDAHKGLLAACLAALRLHLRDIEDRPFFRTA